MKETIRSDGTTKTERQLAALCDSTFLKLWSYPNLYTPEGMKNGKGKGKELCDLLVVTENDIVVFSDKDIAYREDCDPIVAWNRWRRRSIIESAGQLYGAEKWIRERPNEIYLDDKCTQSFPLEIREGVTIHLVAITNNSYFPALRHFGAESTGSLVLNPLLPSEVCEKHPFLVGDVDSKKTFVHVFDEITIQLLLSELDTAYDFVKYLGYKSRIFRSGMIGTIHGEEDFLALYLENGGLALSEPLEELISMAKNAKATLSIGEGYWSKYLQSDFRELMREANKKSYYWDDLIDNFSNHILAGTVAAWKDESVLTHERAIRYMASEGRIGRTVLAGAFMEKLLSVPMGIRSARVCASTFRPDRYFVIVVFPRREGESDDDYRENRRAAIYAYTFVTKLIYSKARLITVIGTEPIGHGIRSEDVISMEIDELTEEDIAKAKMYQSEYSIFNNIESVKDDGYANHVRPMKRNANNSQGQIKRKGPCPCGSGKKAKRCCYTDA